MVCCRYVDLLFRTSGQAAFVSNTKMDEYLRPGSRFKSVRAFLRFVQEQEVVDQIRVMERLWRYPEEKDQIEAYDDWIEERMGTNALKLFEMIEAVGSFLLLAC